MQNENGDQRKAQGLMSTYQMRISGYEIENSGLHLVSYVSYL